MKPIDANFEDIKALSKSRALFITNTRNVDMALANRATEMRDYPFPTRIASGGGINLKQRCLEESCIATRRYWCVSKAVQLYVLCRPRELFEP